MAFSDNLPGHGSMAQLRHRNVCSQKHILVAEPCKRLAKYMQRILEKHLDCRVDIARNGTEALSFLDKSSCDALVTEIKLPGLDGLELVHEAHSAFPDMGIIVLDENNEQFPYLAGIRAGATDCISKPFLPAELAAKLIRVFNESLLREERRLESLKYRSLFDLSIDGMALLDGGGAVIRDVNRSLLELLGDKKTNLIGKPAAMLLDVEDRYRFEQWLSLCALIGRGAISDLKLAHAASSNIFVDISMTVVKNEAQFGIFLVMKNITERREMQLRLDEITQRDLLTGLFNRRSFVNKVHGAVRSAQEYNIPTTLMMIDMDGLKAFNDAHGHATGDQMLIEAASSISLHIHPSTGDACFRYDGDEFAILLAGVDADEGRQVAKHIRDEFYSRDTKGLTISIGISEYLNSHSVDDFIRAAERAVVEAKEMARDIVSKTQAEL